VKGKRRGERRERGKKRVLDDFFLESED